MLPDGTRRTELKKKIAKKSGKILISKKASARHMALTLGISAATMKRAKKAVAAVKKAAAKKVAKRRIAKKAPSRKSGKATG